MNRSMKREPKDKRVAESQVMLVQLMEISDANIGGIVHGGVVMKLVDTVAGLAAIKHAGGLCVTVSMDEMSFVQPVHVGDLVSASASVNDVGTTSMEVGVRVEVEDIVTGERMHTSSAYLVFVALDDDGKPRPVPPLLAETAAQIRRQREAKIRREARMAQRKTIEEHRQREADARGDGRGRAARRRTAAVAPAHLTVATSMGSSELAGARGRLETAHGTVEMHRLGWLADQGLADPARLPHTARILLENLLRRAGTPDVADADVLALAAWPAPARRQPRVHAHPRPDAGFHGGPRRGGSGGDAQRDGARGRRSRA